MIALAPIFPSLGLLGLSVLAGLTLWPRRGFLAQHRQHLADAVRIRREDALKHLCLTEAGGGIPTFKNVAGALGISVDDASSLLEAMDLLGLVTFTSGILTLTSAGRSVGIHVIRAHRLWECHLAENTGTAGTDWHDLAEHHEHELLPEDADALAAALGNPTHDPHGDPIRNAGGSMPIDCGLPLNTLEPGDLASISHLEDELANVYAQLAAFHLRPGMRVELKSKTPFSVRFTADGVEHIIPPILAHQIEVRVLTRTDETPAPRSLADFKPGEKGIVLRLADGSRGPERRRLLDLGLFAP
jgi:DtxR family Mn-dependent transcriptional regulator